MTEGAKMNNPILTVDEFAKLFRVTPMTIYRQLKTDKISYHRIGKKYFFTESDVEKTLELAAKVTA
jgi:excisionase family DNA binding protein